MAQGQPTLFMEAHNYVDYTALAHVLNTTTEYDCKYRVNSFGSYSEPAKIAPEKLIVILNSDS